MTKSLKLIVGIFMVVMIGCKPSDPPYTNQYTKFCQCTHEYKDVTLKLDTPHKREVDIIEDLLEVNGIPQGAYPYKLCRSETPLPGASAFATTKDGYPFIIYDPESMDDYSASIVPYHTMFVMAHELAHLMLWHSFRPIEDDLVEQEADIMAGSMLYKLGVDLQNAIDVKSEDKEASFPHASGLDRRRFIKDGWMAMQAAYNGEDPGLSVTKTMQPLRKSYAKVGGKKYTTIIANDREIMSQDFAYKIGSSLAKYYTHSDAVKACQANGWDLLTYDDVAQLISRFDNVGGEDGSYNQVRAFGALVNKGDSGFNAGFGGMAYRTDNGKSQFHDRGVSGYYWVDTYNFFDFNRSDGELQYYRNDDDTRMLSCRCARDI